MRSRCHLHRDSERAFHCSQKVLRACSQVADSASVQTELYVLTKDLICEREERHGEQFKGCALRSRFDNRQRPRSRASAARTARVRSAPRLDDRRRIRRQRRQRFEGIGASAKRADEGRETAPVRHPARLEAGSVRPIAQASGDSARRFACDGRRLRQLQGRAGPSTQPAG